MLSCFVETFDSDPSISASLQLRPSHLHTFLSPPLPSPLYSLSRFMSGIEQASLYSNGSCDAVDHCSCASPPCRQGASAATHIRPSLAAVPGLPSNSRPLHLHLFLVSCLHIRPLTAAGTVPLPLFLGTSPDAHRSPTTSLPGPPPRRGVADRVGLHHRYKEDNDG